MQQYMPQFAANRAFVPPLRDLLSIIDLYVSDALTEKCHNQMVAKAAQLSGHNHVAPIVPSETGVCRTWLKTGKCVANEEGRCRWKHLPIKVQIAEHPKGAGGKGSPSKSSKGETKGKSRTRTSSPSTTRMQTPRGRDSTAATGSRSDSKDPKKVCRFYLKGECRKSHEECPFIHNPTCWWYRTTGSCKLGDKCLFPHRGESGVLIAKLAENTATSTPAPAAAGVTTETPTRKQRKEKNKEKSSPATPKPSSETRKATPKVATPSGR